MKTGLLLLLTSIAITTTTTTARADCVQDKARDTASVIFDSFGPYSCNAQGATAINCTANPGQPAIIGSKQAYQTSTRGYWNFRPAGQSDFAQCLCDCTTGCSCWWL